MWFGFDGCWDHGLCRGLYACRVLYAAFLAERLHNVHVRDELDFYVSCGYVCFHALYCGSVATRGRVCAFFDYGSVRRKM